MGLISRVSAGIILTLVFLGVFLPTTDRARASDLLIRGPFYKYVEIRDKLLSCNKSVKLDIDGVHVLISFANRSKLVGLSSILLGNIRAVEKEILSKHNLSIREDYLVESFLGDIVLDDLRDYLFLVDVYSGNNSMFIFYVVDNSTPNNHTVVNQLMRAVGEVVGETGVEVEEVYVYLIILDIDARDYPRVGLDKIHEEFREMLSSYCPDCMVLIGYGFVPGFMIVANSDEQALKVYQLIISREFSKEISPIMVNFSKLTGSDIIEIIVLHNKLEEIEYVGIVENNTSEDEVFTADADTDNRVNEEPSGDTVNTSSGNTDEQDGNDNSVVTVMVWSLVVVIIISVFLVVKRIIIGG